MVRVNLFAVQSSNQITETNEEFKSMTGHIQNSHKLLTKYGRREFTDKLLIILALVFYFATVLYIVKKRMFGLDSVQEAAQNYVDDQNTARPEL